MRATTTVNAARAGAGAAAASGAAALLWVIMAITHPETTYHFAPIIVVAAAPATLLATLGAPLGARPALGATAVGLGFAVVATTVILATHSLRGPAFLGSMDATGETIIALVLGVAAGLLAGLIRMRRHSTPATGASR